MDGSEWRNEFRDPAGQLQLWFFFAIAVVISHRRFGVIKACISHATSRWIMMNLWDSIVFPFIGVKMMTSSYSLFTTIAIANQYSEIIVNTNPQSRSFSVIINESARWASLRKPHWYGLEIRGVIIMLAMVIRETCPRWWPWQIVPDIPSWATTSFERWGIVALHPQPSHMETHGVWGILPWRQLRGPSEPRIFYLGKFGICSFILHVWILCSLWDSSMAVVVSWYFF